MKLVAAEAPNTPFYLYDINFMTEVYCKCTYSTALILIYQSDEGLDATVCHFAPTVIALELLELHV